MRVLRMLSLTFLFVALGGAPALAQQSANADDSGTTLSANALDATLAGHESAVDQQRAKLAELLSRDQVRDVASDRGIDMGRVESAAAGLSDAQVRAVSPLVATVTTVQEEGGGGLGSVTISVVALILILLVLILVT